MPPKAKLPSPADLKTIFDQLGRRPSRSLGQNFLVDERVLGQFLAVAAPQGSDIIVEVGAGLGAVTQGLIGYGSCVIAVEKDRSLAARLKKRLAGRPNVRVVAADILTWPARALPSQPYRLVASLPYSITTPFLKKFLLALARRPLDLTLILQTEAAERLAAQPPRMNALAFLGQSQSRVKLGAKISPAAFWPQPKVASRIVQLTNLAPRLSPAERRAIKLAGQAFRWPRKTLWAISARLAPTADRIKLVNGLRAAGLDIQARPAALTVKQWRSWLAVFEKIVS